MADIDDLKAAFDQLVTAINTRNLNAFVGSFHEQTVHVVASPFFTDGRAALRQVAEVFIPNAESIDWKSVSPQFRIIGGTGITWGHVAYTVKPSRLKFVAIARGSKLGGQVGPAGVGL
jgi:hypothetical protein